MGLWKDSLGCGRNESFTSGGRMGCKRSPEPSVAPGQGAAVTRTKRLEQRPCQLLGRRKVEPCGRAVSSLLAGVYGVRSQNHEFLAALLTDPLPDRVTGRCHAACRSSRLRHSGFPVDLTARRSGGSSKSLASVCAAARRRCLPLPVFHRVRARDVAVRRHVRCSKTPTSRRRFFEMMGTAMS